MGEKPTLSSKEMHRKKEVSYRDWFKRKVERMFGVQKEQKGAPISVEMFFATHETAQETRGFFTKLQEADIIILESFGWTRAELGAFQQVSLGIKTPEDILPAQAKAIAAGKPKSRLFREVEVIFYSYKPIIILDIPRGHPLEPLAPEGFKFADNFRDIGLTL